MVITIFVFPPRVVVDPNKSRCVPVSTSTILYVLSFNLKMAVLHAERLLSRVMCIPVMKVYARTGSSGSSL